MLSERERDATVIDRDAWVQHHHPGDHKGPAAAPETA